jgi:hypothetical protein
MNTERVKYPLSHEWHVAINRHSDTLRQDGKEWIYEAKTMADEVTLDQALAQPVLQRLVTGCAKVMRADAARWQAEEARVDRYGARPVRPQRRHAVRHLHHGRRP